MTPLSTPRNALLAVAAALLLAGAAAAQDAQASVAEQGDDVVLANAALTATLQARSPDLRIAPAGDDGTGAFAHRFTQLVEYRDLDGDGAPSADEVLGSFDLAGTSGWELTTNATNGTASANLTRTGPVALARAASGAIPTAVPTSPPDVALPNRTATVSLVFSLAGSATEVAVDLVVAQWPALGAGDTRLALLMEADGNVTPDDGRAEVARNGTSVGALAWAPNATGTTADGEAVEVPVRATAEAGANATRLAFVYDAAGLAALAHGGAVGLAAAEEALDEGATGPLQSVKEAPGAPLVGALAVAAGAALLARRR